MDDPGDHVAQRSKARVGQQLKDKWRLDRLLGVGGMAAVYAAEHRNGKRVAIKILHVELSVDPEVRSRFLREGYVANKVEHAGAVSVLDDEIADDGAVFLVMDLLEGETLARRWERKERAMPPEEVLLITEQLLDVLAAAHAKDIVHRDIKPDNVFVTREGAIKVLDFGIARLREISTAQTHATRSGMTMGTPAYMASEQARGRWDEVDARTDLWAVGATMFKLLTGHVVHEADTVNEQLLAAMTKPAPPIATLVPALPCPVVEIVDKALAFDRDARWVSARAMQEAVREAYQAMVGTAIPLGPYAPLWDVREEMGEADTIFRGSKASTPTTAPVVSRDDAEGASRAQRKRRVVVVSLLCAVAAGVGLLATGPMRDKRDKLSEVVDTMASAFPALAESAAPAEGQPADDPAMDGGAAAAIDPEMPAPSPSASAEGVAAVAGHATTPRAEHGQGPQKPSGSSGKSGTVHKGASPKHTGKPRKHP